MKLRILIVYMFPLYSYKRCRVSFFLLGCLCGPVIYSVFGRRCRKTVIRGREDTRVWFSQMVSYDFLSHEPLHGYFLYLVSAPPENPQGVANLKKAICVVRSDSIMGVTL